MDGKLREKRVLVVLRLISRAMRGRLHGGDFVHGGVGITADASEAVHGCGVCRGSGDMDGKSTRV